MRRLRRMEYNGGGGRRKSSREALKDQRESEKSKCVGHPHPSAYTGDSRDQSGN